MPVPYDEIHYVIDRLQAWKETAERQASKLGDEAAKPFINQADNFGHLIEKLQAALKKAGEE